MLYSKVLTSTMNIVKNIKYNHGLAIVSREMMQASGRGGNKVIKIKIEILPNEN
jgi:hypothetical protein